MPGPSYTKGYEEGVTREYGYELLMHREGFKTKGEAQAYLFELYYLNDEMSIRGLSHRIARRWHSGISRDMLTELKILYRLLHTLLRGIKAI